MLFQIHCVHPFFFCSCAIESRDCLQLLGAVKYNDFVRVEVLLDCGVHPNSSEHDCESAVDAAIAADNCELLKFMLQHVNDVVRGHMLHKAANDRTSFKFLRCASSMNTKDEIFDTKNEYRQSNFFVIYYLPTKTVFCIRDQSTPLQIVLSKAEDSPDRLQIVDLLLFNGAKPNTRIKQKCVFRYDLLACLFLKFVFCNFNCVRCR